LHLQRQKEKIMEKTRILFVSQEIVPYLKDSQMGTIGRYLPQGIQEKGREIRTFMPRFGHINERRNQLHEVIRLSGMNLIIDDTDHPLIIKVASIQSARMQIYFIDNEDYFQRKFMFRDKNNKFFKDNEERAIFFSRGVIETVKKLGWSPDIVHCHGWMTSLIPLYIKKAFKENPLFSDTKVVTSLYDDEFDDILNKDFPNKIKLDGITNKDLKHFKKPSYESMMMSAIDFSEGIIIASENAKQELIDYANASGKPVLPLQADKYIDAYNNFYDKILASPVISVD
jgi:starch synthase